MSSVPKCLAVFAIATKERSPSPIRLQLRGFARAPRRQ